MSEGRAKLSFGTVPANPEDYLPKEPSLPPGRYTVTSDGDLIDDSTGQSVTDPAQQEKIVHMILEQKAQEARVIKGRMIATRIVDEDFAHLSDVPMSSRASVSRGELLNSLVKAVVIALKESGR